MKQKIITIILILVIFLPVLLPLLNKGFFSSDDGEWMVIRFSAFYQAMRDGEFPVRWLGRLNHEYGYPVANFLYPGFMYLGVPLHIIGFGFVNTIKIILGSSIVLSLLFVYLWLLRLFNRLAALVGGVVYIYLPYHLFDLYKRGSVGELLALAIVPFILWQIERRSVFWASLGVGFLILSHNTLALLFLPLLFIYMMFDVFVSKNKKQLLSQHVSILLFGLFLSAFFWIPAVYDLRYTVFFKSNVSNWNEYFVDISLIGISTFLIFVYTLVLFITKKVKASQHRLTIFLFIVGIVSIFFTTSFSSQLWNIMPITFIQFPFRLLSITILCAAFLSAFIVSVSQGKSRITACVVIVSLTFISAAPFMSPSGYFDKGDSFYSTNVDTTTVKNEYMPLWVKKIPAEIPQQKISLKNGNVLNLSVKTNEVRFDTKSERASIATFYQIYFPGWIATIDGKDVKITYESELGVMNIDVPSGNHRIIFLFQETGIRLMSDILTGVGIFMLIGYSFRKKIIRVVKV